MNEKVGKRRWRIVQRGIADNGLYSEGTLIGITKSATDRLYVSYMSENGLKWMIWNKTVEVNGKKCFLIPPGKKYKILGLRDRDFCA